MNNPNVSVIGERPDAPAPSSIQETSKVGAQALAKASVEARFTLAHVKPRSIEDVRVAILRDCERPSFADSARYHLPIGDGVEDYSIRFIEAVLQKMGNIKVDAPIIYEDDIQRVIRVDILDLETNYSVGSEAAVLKTVERKHLKQGQKSLGVRRNSNGEQVYIVDATERELSMKANAEKSKIMRTEGKRLIPQWLLDECEMKIKDTMRNRAAKDPDAERRALIDAFAELGVKPSQLEEYLTHALEACTPAELIHLRAVFATLREGAAKWGDFVGMATAAPPKEGERDQHIDLRKRVSETAARLANKGKPAAPPATANVATGPVVTPPPAEGSPAPEGQPATTAAPAAPEAPTAQKNGGKKAKKDQPAEPAAEVSPAHKAIAEMANVSLEKAAEMAAAGYEVDETTGELVPPTKPGDDYIPDGDG